ncbi:nucleolar protein 14 [Gautieria morchelliformis]|nr:nucleolar protein 14 [Gautieria morchelliformis]
MVRGSQLTQLKSALSESGLSRKSQSNASGKKRKRSTSVAPSQTDKDKATKKLREIHERLNPFDVKVTKLKHDVGGRKLKGVTGRPGLSKQAGIEQRKKTLLVEYDQKNHVGGIMDRRFGENDPTMPPEERMLERYTRERQRASKGVAFNIEDDDELTHYGQSLSALDDFDGSGLNLDDNDGDPGQIDGETVGRTHFGGFEEEDEISGDEGPARKKSKAEVMGEIIAKSKEHKYQRQMEKQEDENARFQLDQEFDSIRGLLFNEAGPSTSGSNSVPLGRAQPMSTQDSPTIEQGDQEYDQFVRELAFDKRAKPKDRTKTEDELALEEKEALEVAERARMRRMMGLEDDNEAEAEGRKGGKRKRERERGGDDAEDNFVNEDDGDVLATIGTGLVSEREQLYEEEDGETDIAETGEDATGSSDENQESLPSDLGMGRLGNRVDDSFPFSSLTRVGNGKAALKDQDLPFTFPCPASHEDFLSIIENIDDGNVPMVVQRIRSLHHPSLSNDNPAKLQALIGVLVDHIIFIASPPSPRFPLIESLVPHIYALTQTYPVASAQAFVKKLSLMQKNFVHGLSQGATFPHSKTWPGLPELGLLRVLGIIWSASDMNHAVISPARVLMGEYLGLGRIRSIADLASGLFLCTMFLQFEELSKRLIPEAINFLLNAVLHIVPQIENSESVPGAFPIPDFDSGLTTLRLHGEATQKLSITRTNLVSLLRGLDECPAQSRLDLLATTLQLLGKFAEIYKSLDGFLEIYTPVLEILQRVTLDDYPVDLQKLKSNLQDALSRLLKFSALSRLPLRLQAHKPIPIPSYVPKFSATSSNFLRKQDPDHERAAAAKLRHQVKEERKGAIRELRKDTRFLATVQQKRQMEEAKAYNARMKKVFSSIESERAEQNALDREKAREKKRAGRK